MAEILGNYSTLSAMIAPALFLTATGSLIISTSNRLARIVDRVRSLNENLDKIGRTPGDTDFVEERIELLHESLDRMHVRSDHVRVALTLLYVAFGTFCGTSLSLALDVWLNNRLWLLPTVLAILGVGLLLTASTSMGREAMLSLGGNDREMKFYRQLEARRRAGD